MRFCNFFLILEQIFGYTKTSRLVDLYALLLRWRPCHRQNNVVIYIVGIFLIYASWLKNWLYDKNLQC